MTKNAGALLYHVMKQRRFLKDAIRTAVQRRSGSGAEPRDNGSVQMIETRIYVGLNDSESRKQILETEEYVKVLKDVCRSYHTAFSMDIEEGGYYHEDGEYTEETSLVLVLVDAEQSTTRLIAKELCKRFHQESVLITEDPIHGCFVSAGDDGKPA